MNISGKKFRKVGTINGGEVYSFGGYVKDK
jgi:hypothetical protein